jgi:STE24 endopeptidase
MNHHTIQTLYFLILLLYTITEITLLTLNARSARKSQAILPESIKNLQDKDTLKKTIAYTHEKTRLSIIQTLYGSTLLYLIIYHSLFGTFDQYLSTHISSFYIRGSVFIIGISIIFSILQLPLSLYSTFVIEEKYGFNKTTFKLWITDLIKSSILSILLITPLLITTLYFIAHFQDNWWLYVFCLVAGFQILLMLVYPAWIAPLFNKFEPLQNKELAEEISTLADTLAFETQGIYQMDASKRSAHGNAYFAGFGRTRRIVLFDTLINSLSNTELCAVLAHEIGHAKKRHILKSVLFSLVLLLASLYFASLLLTNEDFFLAFGIQNPSSYALLLLFGIAFEPLLFFLSPLSSILSRKNEYEADRYAIDAMKGFQSLETALAKLSTKSLSNLFPHPWYSFFHYSHPTLLERIEAMKKYAHEEVCP